MVEKSGEVIKKNKRRAQRNSNKDTAKLGIVREPMNIKVMEDFDGKTHFDKLIDPALVVIFDSARETGFNLLNNAKNSMIDKFRSIKWLFQEIEELKGKKNQESNQINRSDQENTGKKIDQDGSQQNCRVQGTSADQEDKISLVEQKV